MNSFSAHGAMFWYDWMVRSCAVAVCTDLGRRDVAAALRQMPPLADADTVAATRSKLQDLVAFVADDRSVGARAAGILIVVGAGLLTWEDRLPDDSIAGARVAYQAARRAALFADGLGIERSDIALVVSTTIAPHITALN